MLSMNLPQIDHRALYKTAVSQTGRNVDKAVLQAMEDRVVKAGEDYTSHLNGAGAWAVTPLLMSADEDKLARKMYDSRLVSKEGICRQTYVQIRQSATACPYCEYGEVYEVDHFLPKDDFPELNIFPANLVPICHPCNHIKLVGRPMNAADSLLHPYFDRLPRDVRWLFATMSSNGNGPVLAYSVQLDAAYGSLAGRLSWHFDKLQLGRRFRERSSKVLVEIESDLEGLFETLGPDGLSAHFSSVSQKKFSDHGNVLEAAAYAAAAANLSYCAGDYRN
jgi:5-methylcytosine-specific restriction endonuclease McrA